MKNARSSPEKRSIVNVYSAAVVDVASILRKTRLSFKVDSATFAEQIRDDEFRQFSANTRTSKKHEIDRKRRLGQRKCAGVSEFLAVHKNLAFSRL